MGSNLIEAILSEIERLQINIKFYLGLPDNFGVYKSVRLKSAINRANFAIKKGEQKKLMKVYSELKTLK